MRVFVLGLSIVLLVVVLGTSFLWIMAVWGCGIVACTYRGSRFRHPLPAVATWLILAVVSRLTDIGKPEVLLKNVIMLAEGAGFAWVVVSVRHKEFSGFRLVASTAKKAAAFSYTVYLIHFLGMLLLLGLLSWITGLDIRNGVLPGTVAGILLYIITLVIVMTFP
jgi:peptidoglycan/LPS O-acetylase OafA/YrhL